MGVAGVAGEAQMWLNYLANFSHEKLEVLGLRQWRWCWKKRSVVSNTMFDNSHLQAAGYSRFQFLMVGYKPVRTTRDNRIAC